MGKSNKPKRLSLQDIIEANLRKAQKPSLARADLATHSVVIFALQHQEQFREWLNESVKMENEKLTPADVSERLESLHEVIDIAIASTPEPMQLLLDISEPGPAIPDYPGNYM